MGRKEQRPRRFAALGPLYAEVSLVERWVVRELDTSRFVLKWVGTLGFSVVV